MEEYYFLFALAFIWTLFATLQDLKSREVANWLNFSFIAIALAYRAFYASLSNNIQFFILGIAGFVFFFILAHALYYAKAFAGGDAKLLMGYGIILPYSSLTSVFYLGVVFLFLLFMIGSLYSILYSTLIISRNRKKFLTEFIKGAKKNKKLMIASIILLLLSIIGTTLTPFLILLAIIFLIPTVFIYTKALDSCMIKLIPPSKLTEGDWLEKSVKLKHHTIKKSVHGLSKHDITELKKAKKSVWIKEGIPFVPAFLITLLIMVFFAVVLSVSLEQLFLF